MTIALTKLPGLDRERVLAAVEPVLRAHRVEGVELLWKTDQGGRLLELNIELPGSKIPGAGVTIDLCTEISRDLSAALDVADIIPGAYRLQVGSPGVERALYLPDDYERFKGQLAKIKVSTPRPDGQRTLRGTLRGLDDAGRVVLQTETSEVVLELAEIEITRLVFDWNASKKPSPKRQKKSAARKAASEAGPRGSQENR